MFLRASEKSGSLVSNSLGLFIGFALIGAASAQELFEYRGTVFSIGQAQQSCATWLASPEMENYGKAWIGGFWTGANASNAKNHFVGHTTDANGIFAEIEQGCATAPSVTLMNITSALYLRFEKENR
jgi:hypothetical protein